jgi:hypothetical protein
LKSLKCERTRYALEGAQGAVDVHLELFALLRLFVLRRQMAQQVRLLRRLEIAKIALKEKNKKIIYPFLTI